ncbi:ubiquinone biosynthesis protein COQ7 [Terfezia boudieri ATCC MYA-4762]|uniref:5-demethoxyubiquinone hydroxylase, mitochondrial n=1 Tax=Terfezia boudieri ATCC MYA-4762 TaxID=1051890 RepID=A0A3N4LR90_9PEZI|nr:ubiquinone biosynthesis protein COQ7 [Terfezia boudieri ATCC MYA-4762]
MAVTPPLQPRPLTEKERDFLDRALRVNQAGELGANLIYSGQYAILKHDKHLKPLIRHMWDQEVHHLNTFNTLLAKHRVRPTAMHPLWNIAGYAVGVGTALIGKKAAMACTEAVETEIGTHYNHQVRVLLEILRDPELKAFVKRGEVDGELKGLLETIRKFRDDELEHLDTAVGHDSKGAEGYEILTNLIRGGCKAAIWLSSRI